MRTGITETRSARTEYKQFTKVSIFEEKIKWETLAWEN